MAPVGGNYSSHAARFIGRFDEIHHFIREGKDALLGFAKAIRL